MSIFLALGAFLMTRLSRSSPYASAIFIVVIMAPEVIETYLITPIRSLYKQALKIMDQKSVDGIAASF